MVRFRINFEPKPVQTKVIPSYLRILAYNITDKCNLKCPHCFAEDKRKELNTDECKEVLRQAKENGCVRVILCGKEPLLRKDIFDILSYIRALDMDVELMTNGVLINQSIINKLQNVGVKRVQISIDGFEKTHDKIRGKKGAFQAAINSIRLLLENGFKTSVNTVILRENSNELLGLIDYFINDFQGISELRFSRFIPTMIEKPDFEYFNIYIDGIKKIVKYLASVKKVYHIEIEDNPIIFENIIPHSLKDLIIYTPCGVITHTIDVLNNGDVVFCVPMGSHKKPYIHGNVLKDGLGNIIKNIRKYNDINVDDEVCRNCEHYIVHCLGGCRCVAFAYRGNEHSADPFCPKVRKIFE